MKNQFYYQDKLSEDTYMSDFITDAQSNPTELAKIDVNFLNWLSVKRDLIWYKL